MRTVLKPAPLRPAGRADYFGEMPNLAARVAGLAHPGQILVEGTAGFSQRSNSTASALSLAVGGDRSVRLSAGQSPSLLRASAT